MTAPGILFDRESVRTFIQPGKGKGHYATYILERLDGTVVYIGASANPRERLLKHLADGKVADVARVEYHRGPTAMARRERELLDAAPGELNVKAASRHGTWHARKVVTA